MDFNFTPASGAPSPARMPQPTVERRAPVAAPPVPEAVEVVSRPRAPKPEPEVMKLSLDRMLSFIVEKDASDLHLASDAVPRARINGRLMEVPETTAIPAEDMSDMLLGIMNDRQREIFERTKDIDLSYSLGNRARFRVNVFSSMGKVGSVMRLIPTRIRTVEEMNIPEGIRRFAHLPRGLVLVTGPTGSGKSTLLASLIDLANSTRPDHIVTIEDPVEFTHQSKLATVTQRQVGEDTEGFGSALRAVLRQDPDIILIGELRDLATTRAAIEAADTGHLVFGTMHTKSTYETVERIINIFPGAEQNQVQSTLSSTLEGVVTQLLAPTADGQGRVPIREVMIPNDAIRSKIRTNKLQSIRDDLQSNDDMYRMDTSLARAYKDGIITMDTALKMATDRTSLTEELNGKPGY